MTAPASIKQSDLKRMAEVAKSKGVRVEMEVDGRIFRVSPDIPDNHSADEARPKKRLEF